MTTPRSDDASATHILIQNDDLRPALLMLAGQTLLALLAALMITNSLVL